MNIQEHALTILAEECNETAQRISKALRFGFDEVQPGQALTNLERIAEELHDINTAIQFCHECGVRIPGVKKTYATKKIERLTEALELARQLGTIQ